MAILSTRITITLVQTGTGNLHTKILLKLGPFKKKGISLLRWAVHKDQVMFCCRCR